MIGVVLWSDPLAGKAVIWCEDHGELAFYHKGDALIYGPQEFDAGDLVSFDVETESNLRYAYNPQVIEGGFFRDLPQSLTTNAAAGPHDNRDVRADARPTAEVIPLFGPGQAARIKLRELAAKTG